MWGRPLSKGNKENRATNRSRPIPGGRRGALLGKKVAFRLLPRGGVPRPPDERIDSGARGPVRPGEGDGYGPTRLLPCGGGRGGGSRQTAERPPDKAAREPRFPR